MSSIYIKSNSFLVNQDKLFKNRTGIFKRYSLFEVSIEVNGLALGYF